MSFLSSVYSYDKQQFKAKIIEEFTEASLAFQHFEQGKVDSNDLLDELADAYFQIEKAIFYLEEIKGINDASLYFEKRLKKVKANLEAIIKHNCTLEANTINMFE